MSCSSAPNSTCACGGRVCACDAKQIQPRPNTALSPHIRHFLEREQVKANARAAGRPVPKDPKAWVVPPMLRARNGEDARLLPAWGKSRLERPSLPVVPRPAVPRLFVGGPAGQTDWAGDDASAPGGKASERCDGWSAVAYAAPLLDPGASSDYSRCALEMDTQFRLSVTSPAFCTLDDGTTRIYFFDGQVRNAADIRANYPPAAYRVGSTITNVYKFGSRQSSTYTTDDDWWNNGHRAGSAVNGLYFSKDFISFLDSEDGERFELWTPLVDNSDTGAGSCDFAKAPVHYEWQFSGSSRITRAGWTSTVIPCQNASVVYKVDSVLRMNLDTVPIHVLFAVECSGVGRGQGGADLVEGQCILCSPSGPTQTPCLDTNPNADAPEDNVPSTDYVIFVSRSPDFREGTIGPFAVLPKRPDITARQWVGVPQAWMSPDGNFVFYYVHPQPDAPADYDGLSVARTEDFLDALIRIIGNNPDLASEAALNPHLTPAEVESQKEMGRAELGLAFHPVGNIRVCRQSAGENPDPWVDEHFIFCKGRFHLYYTDITGGNPPRLVGFQRATAVQEYNYMILSEYLRSGIYPAFVQDMLLNYRLADCLVTQAAELQFPVSSTDVQVNDPTVHFQSNALVHRRTIVHFWSEAISALLVQSSPNPCSPGECATETVLIKTVPKIPDVNERPELHINDYIHNMPIRSSHIHPLSDSISQILSCKRAFSSRIAFIFFVHHMRYDSVYRDCRWPRFSIFTKRNLNIVQVHVK